MADILVTTTENIPGKDYEIIGEVFGVTTQSRNAISDFGAGLKSIVGGEIKGYTKMLTNSRLEAISRLKEEAAKMGADAVVMMLEHLFLLRVIKVKSMKKGLHLNLK